MSARSIGTATISFGLVSIPVRLYSATQPSAALSFNMLHKKCGGRVKQQYICPRDANEVVERDDMVKGYEFAKDRYVTFSTEELKTLEEQATQTIEIAEFVPLDKVDPVYFDKPYYLGPDKGGDRAYRLIGEVMRRTNRAAIARYAARGKQYLVMLRPVDDGLVMQQLLYADEVRSFSEVPMEATPEVKEAELKLAQQIVEQISTDEFKPGQYEDEVKKRVHEQIQRKVEGQEISTPVQEQPQTQIIDLMEALKASLAARAGKQAAKPAEAAPEAPAANQDPSLERKPAKRAARGAGKTEASGEKKKASRK